MTSAARSVRRARGVTTSGSCVMKVFRLQASFRHCQRWRRSFTVMGAPCAGSLENGALASRVGARIAFRSLDRRETRRPLLKSATDRRSLRGRNAYALPQGPTRSSLHAVKLLLAPPPIKSATESEAEPILGRFCVGPHRSRPACLDSSPRILGASLPGLAERGALLDFVAASEGCSPTRAATKSKATVMRPSPFPLCRNRPRRACVRQAPNAGGARCKRPDIG